MTKTNACGGYRSPSELPRPIRSARKIHIGDVRVIEGTPPDNNPYRAQGLMGKDRVEVLQAFAHGIVLPGRSWKSHTFWDLRQSMGPNRQIHSPAEIDWTTSGIEPLEIYK